ncbi:GntR family transcriptional regulator [Catellatospora sp. KI3]|uniref:GntR family transcriptional regulator n=1 Tax=Catellatospora sp. KI3 TaxID=3041620 RepID=UPI0024821619|nr:GntR family transcriptional regulator [Catellatospora sp. KI3]MDI1466010.1 GntR family transcriptional regulator [Catellatospora sp. KI3]
MIVEYDPNSPVPPYEQVRAQLATMIGSGVLPPGTQLPSIRQLAADLGVATGTIARVYRELEADGLVVSRVRHGTTVAARPSLSRAEVADRLAEAARTYLATARLLGADLDTAVTALRTAAD